MTTMKQVMDAGKDVAEAYAKFLAASDALAELTSFNPEYVLRRVMPLKPRERRNSKKVLDYLKSEYDEIQEHLEEVAKEEAEESARVELLAKLDLSDADKKLLGINF